MIHLDYRDARPIYTQIADGFREQILSGILMPQDRLPSVRELATQLAINPNTISDPTGNWKWRAGSPPSLARVALSAVRPTPPCVSGKSCLPNLMKSPPR